MSQQGQRLEQLRDSFRDRFGRDPTHAVRAPGRVNLIGEHTDYNEGLVLPCAIDRDVVALAAARDDSIVRVVSEDQGEAEFRLGRLAAHGAWLDYVKAPASALAARGIPLPGIDLSIGSEVPPGAGLSSSAALGVAVAQVWLGAAGVGLSPRIVAEAVHEGENRFVGVGCGILDPFASALGRRAPDPGRRRRVVLPEDDSELPGHDGRTRRQSLASGFDSHRLHERALRRSR
jgi:galactokinase